MLGLITVKSLRPSCKIISSQRSTSALRMAANIEKLPKNVLVTVADGIEEIETVTIVDTLVRSGATVVVASVSNSLQVTCSRGVKLVADRLIGECIANEWDLM